MTSTSAARIERPASVFRTLMAAISIPMALLLPLWVVAGRVLFGAGGQLVLILGLTLGPLLAIVHLWAAILINVTAARYRPFAAGRKTSFLLLGAYAAAFAFGFTVPDTGQAPGSGGSALSRLAGEDAAGISAALSNPLGILLLGLSVALLVTAFREECSSRPRGAQGSKD